MKPLYPGPNANSNRDELIPEPGAFQSGPTSGGTCRTFPNDLLLGESCLQIAGKMALPGCQELGLQTKLKESPAMKFFSFDAALLCWLACQSEYGPNLGCRCARENLTSTKRAEEKHFNKTCHTRSWIGQRHEEVECNWRDPQVHSSGSLLLTLNSVLELPRQHVSISKTRLEIWGLTKVFKGSWNGCSSQTSRSAQVLQSRPGKPPIHHTADPLECIACLPITGYDESQQKAYWSPRGLQVLHQAMASKIPPSGSSLNIPRCDW